jgi:hypothetical protein
MEQALENIMAQLRIKLAIGKMSGVAAALSNLGMISTAAGREVSPAFMMTAEQMTLELGLAGGWAEKEDSSVSQEFLTDPSRIELGRVELESISPELLPYYDGAIERRLGSESDRLS